MRWNFISTPELSKYFDFDSCQHNTQLNPNSIRHKSQLRETNHLDEEKEKDFPTVSSDFSNITASSCSGDQHNTS